MTEKDINKPRTIRCTGYEMDYLKEMLALRRSGEIEQIDKIANDANAPIDRTGITPDDFLKQKGLPPLAEIEPDEPAEPEKVSDNTEWRSDPLMLEIDRGVCYETDADGYPEDAERFSRRYPEIWVRAFQAKQGKRIAEYNEIMNNEVWGIIKNGRF